MANNILLLEDDMSLIDGLQYSLKKNGYAVEVARTVSEAKRLLQNIDQYDLLILDVDVYKRQMLTILYHGAMKIK